MPEISTLAAFGLVALGMVLTPGPNMIYLVSRSLSQGPAAGLISLGGVALGFVFYILCAAFGITALVFAVPYAYDALRICGALYLLWLAWQALRPGGRSPFQVRHLAPDGPRKLFMMGLMTNLLNPKVAVMYLSLLPQFVDPDRGSVLTQLLCARRRPDHDQRHRQRDHRGHGRLDRRLPRRTATLDSHPALADGNRAGRPGAAHGDRSAAVSRPPLKFQSICAAGASAAALTGAGFLSKSTSGSAQSVTTIISLKSLT
jgi:threonine/homoserine/homoserine lactone efflux protein